MTEVGIFDSWIQATVLTGEHDEKNAPHWLANQFLQGKKLLLVPVASIIAT
jgi:hypothetical protein